MSHLTMPSVVKPFAHRVAVCSCAARVRLTRTRQGSVGTQTRGKVEMRLLKRSLRGSVPLVAVLAAVACVDSDDRCGDNRVYDDAAGVCTCTAGMVDQGGDCVEMPAPATGLGIPCEDAASCTDPAFPDCHTLEDGSGYCTKNDCASNGDCG